MAKKTKQTKEDLKGMKEAELVKKLGELEESIRVLLFKAQGSKSKNVKEYNTLKKNIARVLTEMHKFKVISAKKNK
ncbi:MAG: 50S ribosomal protein L29 [Patescibacteria group bacterium]